MTALHIVSLAIIAVVALGFVRTLRRIHEFARQVSDPEQLARKIATAVEASGVDPERIEVQVEVSGRSGASPEVGSRPPSIEARIASPNALRFLGLLVAALAAIAVFALR